MTVPSVKRNGARAEGSPRLNKCCLEERGIQELDSLRSSEACLLAFSASALASASGANPLIALPRLTAPVPVIFALSASKPPGMFRFFATWAAAMHVIRSCRARCPVRWLVRFPVRCLVRFLKVVRRGLDARGAGRKLESQRRAPSLRSESESNVSCCSSFLGAGGDRTGFVVVLTKACYLIRRMH